MLGFTTAIDLSELRTQACHVRMHHNPSSVIDAKMYHSIFITHIYLDLSLNLVNIEFYIFFVGVLYYKLLV